MVEFIDGLKDRIARKVERHTYHDLEDVLHHAVQAEQHIKRKNTSTNRSKTTWTPQPQRALDNGKAVEVDNQFHKSTPETSKANRPEVSKASTQRARDITCFKCQGKGHYAREFPNQRVMILKSNGEYESQDEGEEAEDTDEDIVDYLDQGELLVVRQARSALFEPETIQRENVFHSRCTINTKVCSLIIDGGSCTNVASKYLVDKLGLTKTKHPRPYKLKWLNDETELKITEKVTVPFSIGKYTDQVVCDVVPMQAGHLLIGRPWQFYKETLHNGRTNYYTFTHNNKKHNLAPLTPQEVHDMHKAMSRGSEKEILKLLEAGIIYPFSDSRWVSPVHVVPKKGGITVVKNDKDELIAQRTITGHRMCIDYRKLNSASRKDHFPLPFIDQMLERLANHPYFCFLDGYSGFFQIPIDPRDQEKTTFTCPYGTFAYRRMPFGLCNAPATFQRCMMHIFSDIIEEKVEVFMDDFSVYGSSFSDCLSNLSQVLERCEQHNLVLNWEKCHFMVQEGIVLGHKISEKGIEVDRAKVEVMVNLQTPTSVKGIRSFLGHAGFYRRFIKDFS
ncbi:uncharacterized protein LOC112083452, partial [Eutrema salsugineum]|uniref:uncharacterized protein LOC112083452 n=1 Tax=Eutrema salsugineum TaxID=72664 RepID=UPI000CED6E25